MKYILILGLLFLGSCNSTPPKNYVILGKYKSKEIDRGANPFENAKKGDSLYYFKCSNGFYRVTWETFYSLEVGDSVTQY